MTTKVTVQVNVGGEVPLGPRSDPRANDLMTRRGWETSLAVSFFRHCFARLPPSHIVGAAGVSLSHP